MNKEKIQKKLVSFYEIFFRRKILQEAAALTYTTLLGFIPFLSIFFLIFPKLNFVDIRQILNEFLLEIFIPESAKQIQTFVNQLIDNSASFSIASFVILFVTSYSLFKMITDSFDNILNVHESKKLSYFEYLFKFFGMIMFGSLFLLILFSAASFPIFSKLLDFPFLKIIGDFILPFIFIFLLMDMLFFIIPTIKINIKSVILAAFITAFSWIITKIIFNYFMLNISKIKLIFGVFSSLPILLIWIYVNWIVILSGIILVSLFEDRELKNKKKELPKTKISIKIEKIIDQENKNIGANEVNEDKLAKIMRILNKE